MQDSLSRRTFLGASTAALATNSALGAVAPGRNERLSVGIVGPGGRGRGIMGTLMRLSKTLPADLTAVCDLWSVNRERAADLVKKTTGRDPRTFRRLEDMLAWNGLDAVIVATPDHQHAQQLVLCLKASKHVYLEKPFANNLAEANTAIAAARASDRVVIVGTQRRSHPQYLTAAELMKTNPLGPIVRVEITQNAHSPFRWRRSKTDISSLKAADTDWNAFLMGRPARPFDPHRYLEFRLFRDYSTGIIDQWMTHLIDTVHLLTGATFPTSVVAHGGCYAWKDGRENGDTVQVLLDYPQGFLASYGSSLANPSGSGCRVMGRNGTLEYENTWRISDAGIRGSRVPNQPIAAKPGAPTDMNAGHVGNWIECIRKGDRRTACTPEHGYQHSIACIMADRALHRGKRVLFDQRTRTIREG